MSQPYERQLERLAYGEDWDLAGFVEHTNNTRALHGHVSALISDLEESWEGEAAKRALARLRLHEKRLQETAETYDKALMEITGSSSMACGMTMGANAERKDRAESLLRSLPGFLPSWLHNAVNQGGTVEYEGTVVSKANGALEELEAKVSGKREEAAKAAVSQMGQTIHQLSYRLRSIVEQLPLTEQPGGGGGGQGGSEDDGPGGRGVDEPTYPDSIQSPDRGDGTGPVAPPGGFPDGPGIPGGLDGPSVPGIPGAPGGPGVPGAPVEVKGLILAARAVRQAVQECRDQRRGTRLGSKRRNLACHTRVSMDQQCLEPPLPHRSTFLADPPIRIIPVEKGTRVSTVTWVEERPIGPALGSCPEWAPEVPLRLVPKQLVAQVPLAQDPAVSLADPVRQEPAEWAVSAEHLEQLVAQRAPARLQAVPVVSLAGSAVQAGALVARAPAELVPVVRVRVVGLWEGWAPQGAEPITGRINAAPGLATLPLTWRTKASADPLLTFLGRVRAKRPRSRSSPSSRRAGKARPWSSSRRKLATWTMRPAPRTPTTGHPCIPSGATDAGAT